jgi:hypothetical protein
MTAREIAYLVGCMTGPDFPGTKMAEFLARPDANLIAVHGDPDLAVETLSKLAEQDPNHPALPEYPAAVGRLTRDDP